MPPPLQFSVHRRLLAVPSPAWASCRSLDVSFANAKRRQLILPAKIKVRRFRVVNFRLGLGERR